MSNRQFVQKMIDQNQQKIDAYTSQAAKAEGDHHKELLDRVIHHQKELNNYKELQGNLS